MADSWQRAGVEFMVRDSTRTGVSGVQRSLQSLDRAAQGVVGSIGRAAKGIAALAGIGSVAGVALLVRQQMEAVDAAAKWSDRLGIATEKLTGLHHAAELSGLSADQLNLSFQRMTRRIAEAAQGTGEARGALQELGLDAQVLAQQSPDEVFLAVADAMSRIGSQGDKVRLAFKLFDSEGVAMLNLLKGGRAGIQAMTDDAERLGLTLDRVSAAQIEQANDAFVRARASVRGLARQVAVDLSPYLTTLANQFAEGAAQGQTMGDSLITAFESAAIAGAKLLDVMERIGSVTWNIGDTVASWETSANTYARAEERYRLQTGETEAFTRKRKGIFGIGWRDLRTGETHGLQEPKDRVLWEQILQEQRDIEQQAATSMVGEGTDNVGEVERYFQQLRAQAEQRRTAMRAEYMGQQATAWLNEALDFDAEEASQGLDKLGDAAGGVAGTVAKARESVARMDEELAENITITERTAAGHVFAAEQVRYEQAVWEGYADDVDTANRLIEEHRKRLEELAKKQRTMAPELWTWADVGRQALDDLSGTLTDLSLDFENAADHADQFLKRLAALAIQEMVMRPLLNAVGQSIGLYAGGEAQHTGGIVGRGAPREIPLFHKGGLATDEIMAVLRKREVVLTEPDANKYRAAGLMDARGKPTFHDGGSVGGSVPATGGSTRPNVTVKLENKSGASVAADDVDVQFDPDEYVIGVVLRDVAQGGRTRDLMRGRR